MPKNAPIKTLVHKGLTVEGYSRAAVQTYWRIPELKLGFDLGAQPWEFMGTPVWFVSHTHLDHIAALPVYIARRRMMKMEPPTIYLPAHAVDIMQHLLRLVSRLDRGRLPCDLVAVRPGDEIALSRELLVTAHATAHTVPSLGYIVWERRRKLRPEYTHLSGDEIRDLRLSGVEFVAPSHRKDKIHKHGHLHLDDIVQRRDRFQNEQVLFAHFSTRYHARQIREFVTKALPDLLGGRAHLWL